MGQTQGHHHNQQNHQLHGTGNGQMLEDSMGQTEQRQQQKMLPSSPAAVAQNAGGKRNMRSMMESEQQQRRQIEERRKQNRSRSLDPKSAHEIRKIEHSKSARYGPRTSGSSAARKAAKEKELWNPEKAAAQLIGLQLQNPHAAQQNLLSLIGRQQQQQQALQQQQLMPRPYRKQSGQMSMDLDLGADERRDLNVTGLSFHQIAILQKMWERSSESEIADCAKNVMGHLLRSNAQMYQFFGLLGISDREIASSATFLRMSANFAIVLDFILTNVQEEAQKVCLALQCLGAQHARLPWPIEAHHWALFMRCFEDNPPKEVFQNAEGHDLWKIMRIHWKMLANEELLEGWPKAEPQKGWAPRLGELNGIWNVAQMLKIGLIHFLIIQMRQGYDRATGVESAPILPITSGRSSPRYSRSPREIRKASGGRQPSICPRANTMAADVVE